MTTASRTAIRRPWAALAPLLLAACAPALAAADTDADALALQPDASAEAAPAPATRLFLEAAVGRADRRYGLDDRTISRASIDFRHAARLRDSMQGTVSARLDATDPADTRIDNPVLSLREAYVGWQNDDATRVLEFGRVNLREGPGYGYNPTDFFRDHALRTITTANPFSLRENRLGSVMLRGQQLWPGGSLALVYSPKLANHPSDEGFSADLGATNNRHRGVLSLSNRVSEKLNTQILLYKEADAPARVGANLTALVSGAAVAHAEWSYGREPDLLARSTVPQPGAPEASRHRLAAGLTYTTASRLSVTAEFQHNGFALDRAGWQALTASDPAALAAYLGQALALQDNAARQAWLLYATQPDLGMKNLDLTALVKVNQTDRSRMVWLDLRYRWPRFDLALQLQQNNGAEGSEFGAAPVRRSAGLVATVYF